VPGVLRKVQEMSEEYYYSVSLDPDKGFDITDKLEVKFEDNVSGTGWGFGARDIGFFGPKETLVNIQKYVNQYYSRHILEQDLYLMDED
tara:strand:+ start:230 stop:496 length:267 start_codon:yes stop_codon:yes gene_type:complete